jgi:Domain of unknown function (DUF4864)
MRRAILRIVLWGLASLTALPAFAQGVPRPGELPEADAKAVRAVVESQLKALAADQPVQAFAQATPAIREQFRDATNFIEMVRRSYPMLIKPASVSFLRPESRDGTVTQGVQFRGTDGRLWRAVYALERQPDKTWLISGCVVAPGNEAATT